MSASRTLPEFPDLNQLKHQARELLRAYRAGDAGAVEEVARHERQPDRDAFALHDAQRVLARAYGLDSWPALVAHTDAINLQRLHAAARRGEDSVVRRLVAERPELTRRPVSATDEHEAIHYAAREGHVPVVQILLEAGADPLKGIYPNREETSARDLAVARGHDVVVQCIDRHLASTRRASKTGISLSASVRDGKIDEVRQALNADRQSARSVDADGQTLLHVAARHGQIEIASLLLDHGADVDQLDPFGFRALHHALYQKGRNGFFPSPHPELITLLLQRGARVDAWVAAALGDVSQLAQILAEDRAAANRPIDIKPWWGGIYPATTIYPLSIAALHGHEAVCRVLLDSGAHPDAPLDAAYGRSETPVHEFGLPLTFASTMGHLPVVTLLLERGANVNPSIMATAGAIDSALSHGHTQIVALLMGRGAKAAAYALVNGGYDEEAMRLAEQDPQAADNVVWSALPAGKIDQVRRALPLMGPIRDDRAFALMWEAMRRECSDPVQRQRRLEGLELLLQHVRDVNVWKHDGGNVLHRLADRSTQQTSSGAHRAVVAKLLVKHGVDLNAIDVDFQSTPLGYAVRQGDLVLTQALLELGADPNRAGAPWATPLAWARKLGHADIERVLSTAGARA